MASKVKKIRYFFGVFLFSFLAGSFYFFFENFGFFSLSGYVLEAPNAYVERRFWDLLPPECIRYWPVMVFKSSQIRALMEKTIPVRVSTEAEGVGLFHTRITYLEPWLMVEWRGNNWHLSREGYMWAPALYTFKAPNSPIWKVSDTLTRYSEAGNSSVPGGVFPAMFPVGELEKFDGMFRKQAWYDKVTYVDFARRSGGLILRISFDFDGKHVTLTVKGEEDKLGEIDGVLKQIMPQTDRGGGGIFIDMSYPDIVVIARAHEGGLK